MSRVEVSDVIDASPAKVYEALSDIDNLPNRDEEIEGIEFLSDQRRGAGTRFRETRSHGKRTMQTELEVTEAIDDHMIRFVADSGSTVWDTAYTCHAAGSPEGSATRLVIDMQARADKLLIRLRNRLILPMVRKGVAKHLAALKTYCESP